MANGKQRPFPHIFLPGHGDREEFTSPRSGGGGLELPERDRAAHAARLAEELAEAIAASEQIRQRDAEIAGGIEGFYLEFEIPALQAPVLDKLENRQGDSPIELVAVRPSIIDPEGHLAATVFVPSARSEFFNKKITDYAQKDAVTYSKDADGNFLLDERGNRIEKSRRPKNEALVAAIDSVRLAQTRSLFTDDLVTFPEAGQQAWWEVWLRPNMRAVLEHAGARLNIVIRDHVVTFAEREVMLVLATPEALGRLIANTDVVAELRLSRDTPALFMEMTPDHQREWSDDLLGRINPPVGGAPAVCMLDSGSTRRHPLIQPALEVADQQAWRPDWTVEDVGQWRGHGTQMSGLALYGDLTPLLIGSELVPLTHRLESVKILPDVGVNDPDLYGYITASAVGRAEIQAPERSRLYCMAVTADGDHWRGRPSSWSAKVDDLAYGDGTDQRLFVISAGNIGGYYAAAEYLQQNDTAGIESPAQAWNALTVGAVTERCTIADPTLAGWRAMAPAGDLSPCSRTSVPFNDEWPTKPDIVFEGGNHGIDPATQAGDHVDDLALLTTFHRLNERLLTVTRDTSAATALVSRMGAQILAERTDLWPETVRALVVHSAQWTTAMLGHLPQVPRQIHKRLLLRRYGYGVPDLGRALRSAQNDVTLVVEGELQPFQSNGSVVKTRDMMLHDFRWPTAELEALGDAPVRMRVTLSYFIEPNPGERGWTQRHRYASHGLRFAVKRAEERLDTFRRRINKAARDEEERRVAGGAESGWFLGPRLRDKGSIHSDIWDGTAADLASRHAITVYPTGGWWREKPALRRTDRRVRYALVVSLEAAAAVELYTSIQTAIVPDITIET